MFGKRFAPGRPAGKVALQTNKTLPDGKDQKP